MSEGSGKALTGLAWFGLCTFLLLLRRRRCSKKAVSSLENRSRSVALSKDQLEEFQSRGILVVPGILTAQEVAEARAGLHAHLLQHGVDVSDLSSTAPMIGGLSSTSGAGGILDIFYGEWKLKLNENIKIINAIADLWRVTYCSSSPFFEHCFGRFDPNRPLMYIDRVCFRLPDEHLPSGPKKRNKLQRSLTPHLDCCPHEVAQSFRTGACPISMRKWRPIQAFVALTDTVDADEGGFEACPGLHKRFSRWSDFRLPSVNKPNEPAPCVGSFTPIRPNEDRDIIALFEHIPCRAGDLVCWDFRIPHSNARHNKKHEAREVVYLGFLPHVPLNAAYAERQLIDYRDGRNPSDQWVHNKEGGRDKHLTVYNFSDIGRRMMSIIPWDDRA